MNQSPGKQRPFDYGSRFREFMISVGIPHKYVEQLIPILLSWLREGPDNLVAKLKAYKLFYITLLSQSDQDPFSLEEISSEMELGRRGKPRLKNHLLQYFFVSFGTQNTRNAQLVRGFLDLMYIFVPKKVTPEAYQKWKSHVETPKVQIPANHKVLAEYILNDFANFFLPEKLRRLSFRDQSTSFVRIGVETDKRSPVYDPAQNLLRSETRDKAEVYDWLHLWSSNGNLRRFHEEYQSEVNMSLLGTNSMEFVLDDFSYKDAPIGSIACIKEQGGKFRWIANPHLSLQMVGEPIKRFLADLSVVIPWIYTFDQQAGIDRLCELQSDSMPVACFDGTSFTDTFSRDFQNLCMRALLVKDREKSFVSKFTDLISTSNWQCSIVEKSKLSWESGQPLGTGPSFHMACVSHALLIFISTVYQELSVSGHLTELVNDPDSYNQYGIGYRSQLLESAYNKCKRYTGCVGDDSFIAYSPIAPFYTGWLDLTNVKVNKTKSIISCKIAEFCGKWILGNKEIISSKPPASYGHYNQVITAANEYGLSFLLGLRYKETVSRLNLTYAALMPKSLGGLDLCYLKGATRSIDQTLIDQHTIKRTVKLFLGMSDSDCMLGYSDPTGHSIEVQMELDSAHQLGTILAYKQVNSPWSVLQDHERAILWYICRMKGLEMNELTGLPCCHGKPFRFKFRSHGRQCNTFVDLTDNANVHDSITSKELVLRYYQDFKYKLEVNTECVIPDFTYSPLFNHKENDDDQSYIKQPETRSKQDFPKRKARGLFRVSKEVEFNGFHGIQAALGPERN